VKSPRLKTLQPKIKTLDTRTVKPPEKTADKYYATPEHQAWRKKVLYRAGWRCEWNEDGKRCEKRAPTHRMIADHIVEIRDGGDPLGEGQCLCVAHNTLKGIQARDRRMAAKY
jgi:5-methylcytosine-specific restriction protein A